jgi:hypothetical protein
MTVEKWFIAKLVEIYTRILDMYPAAMVMMLWHNEVTLQAS